eukprot:c18660_g1_i1.p1 GENE.c18660_g1_i1~~c18660_g1_i1.p1  ORF type:complete len:162 (+),score=33.33 c18660_g1_i1:243-728(+)
MLKVLCENDATVAITRMDADNLAMVFSACLLRGSIGLDPMEAMQNSNKEKTFVRNLIENLPAKYVNKQISHPFSGAVAAAKQYHALAESVREQEERLAAPTINTSQRSRMGHGVQSMAGDRSNIKRDASPQPSKLTPVDINQYIAETRARNTSADDMPPFG